jgi:hypothetical protein
MGIRQLITRIIEGYEPSVAAYDATARGIEAGEKTPHQIDEQYWPQPGEVCTDPDHAHGRSGAEIRNAARTEPVEGVDYFEYPQTAEGEARRGYDQARPAGTPEEREFYHRFEAEEESARAAQAADETAELEAQEAARLADGWYPAMAARERAIAELAGMTVDAWRDLSATRQAELSGPWSPDEIRDAAASWDEPLPGEADPENADQAALNAPDSEHVRDGCVISDDLHAATAAFDAGEIDRAEYEARCEGYHAELDALFAASTDTLEKKYSFPEPAAEPPDGDSFLAAPSAEDDRCGTCHRDAHRPGMPTASQGHAYVAPSAGEADWPLDRAAEIDMEQREFREQQAEYFGRAGAGRQAERDAAASWPEGTAGLEKFSWPEPDPAAPVPYELTGRGAGQAVADHMAEREVGPGFLEAVSADREAGQ